MSETCTETIRKNLCTNTYIDNRSGLYLGSIGATIKQNEMYLYELIKNFIYTTSKSVVYYDNITYTNQNYVYSNIIDNINYNINNNRDKLLEQSQDFCNLLINATSLVLSLNDNYINECIFFKFMNAVLTQLTTGTSNFVPDIIYEMETINNFVTRPFIRDNISTIINILSESCVNTEINIRGGVACHWNVYKNFIDVNTNDIDFIIYTKTDDVGVSYNIGNTFLSNILQVLNSGYAGHPRGVIFSPQIITTNPYAPVFQVIIEYNNPINNTYTFSNGATVNNLQPKIRHHIIELIIINQTDSSDIEWTNTGVTMSNSNSLFFESKSSLMKDYSSILSEDLHWYRKSKYLRRIAALTGIITNQDQRRLYESEFP